MICLKKLLVPVLFFLALTLTLIGAKDPEVTFIEFPKPTHDETKVPKSKLELVKEIKSDFEEDFFFGQPKALTVDDTGCVFIYDNLPARIFKFRSDFKLETKFLSAGRGPAEVNVQDPGFMKIYFAPDKNIYVCDVYNDKLIAFDTSGKLQREIKLNLRSSYPQPFYPVVDKEGNVYKYSIDKGIIEKLNSKMEVMHTYLDQTENQKFVVSRPKLSKKFKWMEKFWEKPDVTNTHYDILSDNRLVIYLGRPSTVFIFKGEKLVQRFDIHLESQMNRLRESSKEIDAKKKDDRSTFACLHPSLSLDKDDEKHFYLQTMIPEKHGLKLYKFDFKGNLIGIKETGKNQRCYIMAKRNGLFYGLEYATGHVFIFK